MSIMKFEKGVALDPAAYPGSIKDEEAFSAMIEQVNEKIGNGQIDSWSHTNLGYCGYFKKDGDDKSIFERLSGDEVIWIYETVLEMAIDTRAKAWEMLAELGAVKADVEFSGGHDEGGVDGIAITLGDGSRLDTTDWPRDEETNPHWRLAELLALPVYDKYYTFAGEFSVHGIVTWDVAEKTVKMDGSETVEEWHSINEEV